MVIVFLKEFKRVYMLSDDCLKQSFLQQKQKLYINKYNKFINKNNIYFYVSKLLENVDYYV